MAVRGASGSFTRLKWTLAKAWTEIWNAPRSGNDSRSAHQWNLKLNSYKCWRCIARLGPLHDIWRPLVQELLVFYDSSNCHIFSASLWSSHLSFPFSSLFTWEVLVLDIFIFPFPPFPFTMEQMFLGMLWVQKVQMFCLESHSFELWVLDSDTYQLWLNFTLHCFCFATYPWHCRQQLSGKLQHGTWQRIMWKVKRYRKTSQVLQVTCQF